MDVSAAIRSAIEDHGPISFAEFMELALYGPGGFYEDPPVGEEGHFVTSPHVHPVFARLVADAIAGLWTAMDRPQRFSVVELGAGDGTLGERVAKNLPAMEELEYVAIEQSELAREHARARGLATASRLAEIGAKTGCFFANELLDNLPFHRVRASETGELHEIRVAAGPEGKFVEAETPCPPELQVKLAPGREATVPLAAFALIEELAAKLETGYVLFIDYGSGDGEPAGDVHGYRSQRLIEDVLEAPGTADVTAGVDFALISAKAQAAGFQTFPSLTQRDALLELGFGKWNEAERARQSTLMEAGSGADAVKAWGARNEASLLIDPMGLGRLRWLLLATPGLTPPVWLSEISPGDSEN